MEFTDDERIALGEYCEQVLMDDMFNLLTKHFETTTVSHLLSTGPRDATSREEYFSSIRGVRDFLSMMTAFVQEKDRLLTPQGPSDEDVEIDIYATDDAPLQEI